MKTLVVTPETEADFNFLCELLEKLGYDYEVLGEEEGDEIEEIEGKDIEK